MTERSPTQELREEHDAALAAIGRLAEGLPGPLSGTGDTGAAARPELGRALAELREAMLLHFRKEEEGLFPDVQSMLSEGAPRVDIVAEFFTGESEDDLIAHHLLRARMREVGELLAALPQAGEWDPELTARLGAALDLTRDILRRHADKEDRLVFPMIERLLDASQMAAVRARFEAIAKRPWPQQER
jgi:iron-sulfur cluster repair protein YtfE (RIC family)